MRHFGASNLDITLNCVRDVYQKPVLWNDMQNQFLIKPCPSSPQTLEELLRKNGIRVFDALDFVFLISSNLFEPPSADGTLVHISLKWSTIKIHLNLQALHEDDELPKEAPKIAWDILQKARLIPLSVSDLPAEGYPSKGEIDVNIKAAIWTGKLGPGDQESVVACINASPPFSTARLVYGEFRDGQYALKWDSPLFNVLHSNIYFQDVNGDGSKEIVAESTTYGNQEYPILVVFDKNGRELTRQKKCESKFTVDGNFTEENGTCAIYGTDVSFSENEDGPRDIYVSKWYGDRENHVFKLSNGIYVPGPPVSGSFPPSPKETPQITDPAVLNRQGLALINTRDYSSAVTKFMGASLLAGDKSPEYANNVGFALYKAARHDLAVSWLKKAIELDPKRAVAYLNLGDAYVKLIRNIEATQAYSKYLELAPNSKAAPDVRKKLDALLPLR